MTKPPSEIVETSSSSSFSSSYKLPGDSYDEMLARQDALRPHWEKFIRSLDAIGAEELARRWENAKQ